MHFSSSDAWSLPISHSSSRSSNRSQAHGRRNEARDEAVLNGAIGDGDCEMRFSAAGLADQGEDASCLKKVPLTHPTRFSIASFSQQLPTRLMLQFIAWR